MISLLQGDVMTGRGITGTGGPIGLKPHTTERLGV